MANSSYRGKALQEDSSMLTRIVSVITIASITLTSVLLPATQAQADRRILSEKSIESGKNIPVFDPKMYIGDYRITRADEAAVILDLKSSETTDQIIRFSGNSPIVWARYNGNDAKGRIDITRLERTSGDTVRLVIEKFTPEYGRKWSDFHGLTPFFARGYTLSEIGRQLNLHYTTISKVVNRDEAGN
jgi:hypothetical protein